MNVGELLAQGQTEQARQLANNQLQRQPGNASACHDQGLVELVSGDAERAIEWIGKAIELAPDEPRFHCNYGKGLLQLGKSDEAITAFRKALDLDENYSVARYNLACALLEAKAYEEAEVLFRSLTANFPDQPDYICAQGDLAREKGQWQAAIRCYERAIELAGDLPRAEGNLGALLVCFGKGDQALEHCRRAVKLAPASYLGYLHLGRCLVQLEQFDEAMDAFADAYEINNQSASLCVEIAHVWRVSGNYQEAANWYANARMIEPENQRAIAGSAQILLAVGNASGALELLNEYVSKGDAEPEIYKASADALWDEGDADGALQQLLELKAIQPDNVALNVRMGQILSSSGKIDEAKQEYIKALENNPACIPALHGLAIREKSKLAESHLDMLNRLLKRGNLSAASRALLHNALAYYHDGAHLWSEAAEHMAEANRLQWSHHSIRSWNYDADQYFEHCEHLKSVYSQNYFDSVKEWGNSSLAPVFIIGMPRSGTTLTEQILARHPAVLGIGERNYATQSQGSLPARFGIRVEQQNGKSSDPLALIERLDKDIVKELAADYLVQLDILKQKAGQPQVIRVVDKMPDNYSLLGWIVTLFPNAKVIHCRRDLRDVALSCWLTHFGKIQWASRMEDLLKRIEAYKDLMQHWHKVLPNHFLEVDYEATVHHQERESRRLIEWLDLEWDNACLTFYESDRLVRTASIDQVRKPIYKSSVARWEPYSKYIPELQSIRQE